MDFFLSFEGKNEQFFQERPFWVSDKQFQPEAANDGIILNSETTYNVLSGKVELAPEAPEWTKEFDSLGKLSTLQEKDDAAFKNPVIFRNSVRNMIDVNEAPSPGDKDDQEREEYVMAELKINQPRMARLYDPSSRENIVLVPYQPGLYRLNEDGELVRTDQKQ